MTALLEPSPTPRCQHPDCAASASWLWQRAASPEEWDQHVRAARQRHADHRATEFLDPDTFVSKDGRALQLVHACTAHVIGGDTPDLEALAKIHQPDCVPPCACTVLVTP